MPWIQLKLNATAANAEEIGELLMESGALSATFTMKSQLFELSILLVTPKLAVTNMVLLSEIEN